MASLQSVADYALEIMVRELIQAVEVLPQERVHNTTHTYTIGDRTILHRRGEPLNLLDEIDRIKPQPPDPPLDAPNDPNALPDDDTLSRIDFITRSVQQDRVFLPPQDWSRANIMTTYYLRRTEPARAFRFMEGYNPDTKQFEQMNRRQIFRVQWRPDPKTEPTSTVTDDMGKTWWVVDGGWILEDFENRAFVSPPPLVGQVIGHNVLTPIDVDIADLRFTVERELRDPQKQKAKAVVIEMTLRKPTPGAKIKPGMDEPDVPSFFIRRRVRVVLQNVH